MSFEIRLIRTRIIGHTTDSILDIFIYQNVLPDDFLKSTWTLLSVMCTVGDTFCFLVDLSLSLINTTMVFR